MKFFIKSPPNWIYNGMVTIYPENGDSIDIILCGDCWLEGSGVERETLGRKTLILRIQKYKSWSIQLLTKICWIKQKILPRVLKDLNIFKARYFAATAKSFCTSVPVLLKYEGFKLWGKWHKCLEGKSLIYLIKVCGGWIVSSVAL